MKTLFFFVFITAMVASHAQKTAAYRYSHSTSLSNEFLMYYEVKLISDNKIMLMGSQKNVFYQLNKIPNKSLLSCDIGDPIEGTGDPITFTVHSRGTYEIFAYGKYGSFTAMGRIIVVDGFDNEVLSMVELKRHLLYNQVYSCTYARK